MNEVLEFKDMEVASSSAPMQVEYEAYLQVSVEEVFRAVTDRERLCRLMPNLQVIYLRSSEGGLIRRCDFGKDMIVDEQILLWEPPHSYAYAAVAPNPFGLRRHYASVACQPIATSTHLQWRHHYEHSDPAAMLSMFDRIYAQFLSGLVEEFGGYLNDERKE